MYDFLDRPVDSLCKSGRFLLWAMRSWTRAARQGSCPPHAMARCFAHTGLLSMLSDFHILMALIDRDGLERMTITSIEHPSIVEDEAILIGLWRDTANADFDKVRATLALIVDEDSVSPIARALTASIARLVVAGFDLSTLSAGLVQEAK